MPGWRDTKRRAEEATIPTDALQDRGKKAEATILLLKEKFPNWRELDPIFNAIKENERECSETIVLLAERGVEPLFGIGQPKAAVAEPGTSAPVKAEAAADSGKTTKGVETKPAGRVPSKQTNERVIAVADLAKKLESPMSQMPKSKRKLAGSGFTNLLKSEGITDSAEIDLVRDSNSPKAAAIKILSRRKGWKLRTLQNTVSREKAPKA